MQRYIHQEIHLTLAYGEIHLIYKSMHKTLEFVLKNCNKVSTDVATILDNK